ncbi:MAG: ATP-binding cassette domain-containing protein [Deltaproteobacteria bacterium]|nr:ATP-binding cassette domain-containing protein [Deltaproteobacteria bacterium]
MATLDSEAPCSVPHEALITCRDVDVSLGNRLVLESINFSVVSGHIHALVGPNGGGKTTLLRVLLGLLKPQKGQVRWTPPQGNESPTPFPIGFVAQRSSADFRFPVTVRDVVRMVRRGRRTRGEDQDLVDQALARVRMLELSNRPIGELSGGQQQRVLIARALALESPVLMMDEPGTGMDQASQGELLDLMRELKEQGTAIVFSTHHPGDALAIVDFGYRVARTVETVPVADLEEPHACAAHPPHSSLDGVPQ